MEIFDKFLHIPIYKHATYVLIFKFLSTIPELNVQHENEEIVFVDAMYPIVRPYILEYIDEKADTAKLNEKLGLYTKYLTFVNFMAIRNRLNYFKNTIFCHFSISNNVRILSLFRTSSSDGFSIAYAPISANLKHLEKK